jgi:hypothetical protein
LHPGISARLPSISMIEPMAARRAPCRGPDADHVEIPTSEGGGLPIQGLHAISSGGFFEHGAWGPPDWSARAQHR